jgi:MFS family permease
MTLGNNDPEQVPHRLPKETKILAASSLCVAIGFGLISPALPAFATSFHVSITAVTLVVSAFSFLRLCFAPATGRLIGWFGVRSVYLGGLTVVSVSSVACAFVHSYDQLLVVRALGGAGAATFHIAALTMLIRFSPSQLRGRAYALWQGCFLLGTIAGPLIGSALMGFSLRLPFLAYGVVVGLTACVLWFPFRRSMPGEQEEQRGSVIPVRTVLRHRTYQASLLSNFVNGWTVHGMRVSVLPLFISEQLRRGHTFTGIGLSSFAVGYGATLLLAGRWSDSQGRKPVALLGLAIAGLGTMSIGFMVSAVPFLAASIVAGVGAGLLHPAHGAAVADVIGQNSAPTVLAGFEMASDVGGIVGPAVAGAVAQAVSFRLAFSITGLIALVAVLMWLRAKETRVHVVGAATTVGELMSD